MTNATPRLFKCRTMHRADAVLSRELTAVYEASNIEAAARLCVEGHAKRYSVSPDVVLTTLIKPVRTWEKPALSPAALLLAMDIYQRHWQGQWTSPRGLPNAYYKALMDTAKELSEYGGLSEYGLEFVVSGYEVRWQDEQMKSIAQIFVWIL